MCTVLGDTMSKSSSKSGSYRRYGRGASATASDPSRRFSGAGSSGALPRPVSPVVRSQIWSDPDPVILPVDRRYYNPAPIGPAKRLNGRPARVVAPPLQKVFTARPRKAQVPSKAPSTLGFEKLLFQNPSRVNVCVQRSKRKEVLHATGVAGQTGLAKPKRGPYSGISCAGYRKTWR